MRAVRHPKQRDINLRMRFQPRTRLFLVVLSFVCCLCPLASCQTAQEARTSGQVPESDVEGAAHGFPTLRDLNGKKLADGDFVQWLEGGRLHVRISYQFSPVHRVEENGVFRQEPQLIQEKWSWRELMNGRVYRRFEVDLTTGKATAEKWDKDKLRHWSRELKVQPGRAFAGFGFALALKDMRERLIQGERIQLQAVGFTPKPRVVSVEVSHGGQDHMLMSGRVLHGDRFIIHPNIPRVARLFMKVPDTRIWLIHPPPAGFLRWEGPLAEPSDPVIRVDLLPGNQSGPAEPG